MKKKEIKITEKEQRVAVDILQELEMWMMSRPGNSEPSESEQQIYDIADIASSIINKKNGKYYDHELLICCILPTAIQILVTVYFISEAIKGNLY